jgi:hypothetical protein
MRGTLSEADGATAECIAADCIALAQVRQRANWSILARIAKDLTGPEANAAEARSDARTDPRSDPSSDPRTEERPEVRLDATLMIDRAPGKQLADACEVLQRQDAENLARTTARCRDLAMHKLGIDAVSSGSDAASPLIPASAIGPNDRAMDGVA